LIFKNETFANIIIKGNIAEFDMSSAGPSVARAENIITDEKYQELLSYPKKLRQIKFGLHLGEHKLHRGKKKH